jgi:DNA-binding IclR family transcriptional regulator
VTAKKPTSDNAGKTQFGVQSVEIGLRIVTALSDAGKPVMLRDLSNELDMPSAKVHRYLVSLCRAGMVEQDGAGGLYRLGPLALKVGLSALRQLDAYRIAGSALTELRERTEQTALLAVWGATGPTVVRWEESHRPFAINLRMGSVLNLLDSATGLVFAAFLPRHWTERQMAEELDGRAAAEIEATLAQVRQHGMSLVRGNQLASINAMSAPVFDAGNNVAAALTLLGPERRFKVDWNNAAAQELLAASRQVSERLGAA